MTALDTREQRAKTAAWTGLFVNAALAAFKLAAGILGHSTAMIADAANSLSDFVTDIVLLVSFRVVAMPVDKSHDYGHGKFETLATAVIGTFIVLVGVGICQSAIHKIADSLIGKYYVESPGMIALVAAAVSIAVKEWIYRRTARIGREIASPAVLAKAWDHRADALSSTGTMLGIGGAIALGNEWHILDPLAAVVVGAFIIKTGATIAYGGIKDLLEESLDEATKAEIIDISKSVPGVLHPHNLRTRRIGNDIAVDLHIRVDGAMNITAAHDLTSKIETRLFARFGPKTHVVIHVEPCRGS